MTTTLPLQARALHQAAALLGVIDLPAPVAVSASPAGSLTLNVTDFDDTSEAARRATFSYIAAAIGGAPYESANRWLTADGDLAGVRVCVFAPKLRALAPVSAVAA